MKKTIEVKNVTRDWINIDEYKNGRILESLKKKGYFEVSGKLVTLIKNISAEIQEEFKKFINGPDKEKEKHILPAELYLGYQSSHELKSKFKSRFESLLFTRQLPPDHPLTQFPDWYPQNVENKKYRRLRKKCERLIELIDKLNIKVFANLSAELGLKKEMLNYLSLYGIRRLRLLAYERNMLDKSLIGFHQHVDDTFFTVNIDSKEGLYITHKGKSQEYIGSDKTVIYMPGDVFSYMTKNKIPGTLHKVRLAPNKKRVSIVCLINLRPLAKLNVIDEKNNMTSMEHLMNCMCERGIYNQEEYKEMMGAINNLKEKTSDKQMVEEIIAWENKKGISVLSKELKDVSTQKQFKSRPAGQR